MFLKINLFKKTLKNPTFLLKIYVSIRKTCILRIVYNDKRKEKTAKN